jgi:hypothetical protein
MCRKDNILVISLLDFTYSHSGYNAYYFVVTQKYFHKVDISQKNWNLIATAFTPNIDCGRKTSVAETMET